jgi:type IX secretion system PorP/SprF family membrane protein
MFAAILCAGSRLFRWRIWRFEAARRIFRVLKNPKDHRTSNQSTITNRPINQFGRFMKHKSTILPLLLILACRISAQQAPQYSLYMLNPYVNNPAFAGLENTLIVNGVYRQQWSGLTGAPNTQHINAHLPLYMISSGAGIRVENDEIGANRVAKAMVSFNYQLEIGKNALLSAGAGGGFMQYTLDGAALRAPDGVYPDGGVGLDHNDPLLPEGTARSGTPVFELGIVFQTRRLELGIATQPLLAPRLEAAVGDAAFRLQTVRHYIVQGAYAFDLGANLSVRPSLLLKSDLTETQTEVSTIFRWRENIFAGGSFRGFSNTARDAFVVLGGIKLNEKTTVAYSFDIPLSPLSSVQRGSHELMLRYSINKPIGVGKLPPVIYNPRFF